MRGKTVLTAAVIGLLTVGTIWAQMGDDDGTEDKRPERKGFLGRNGRFGGDRGGNEGEGRGPKRRPGMGGPEMGRGPGGDREPPLEMLIGRMIENPEAVKKLGLSEEQINALKDSLKQLREEQESLHEQMRTAAEEQVKLLQADTVDEAALMAAVEKTGAIRTEIAKLRVKGMLLVKKTLTADQVAQVKELIRNRMGGGRERGFREGEGDGKRPRGDRGRDRGFGRDRGREGDGGIRGGWRDRERARENDDDAQEM